MEFCLGVVYGFVGGSLCNRTSAPEERSEATLHTHTHGQTQNKTLKLSKTTPKNNPIEKPYQPRTKPPTTPTTTQHCPTMTPLKVPPNNPPNLSKTNPKCDLPDTPRNPTTAQKELPPPSGTNTPAQDCPKNLQKYPVTTPDLTQTQHYKTMPPFPNKWRIYLLGLYLKSSVCSPRKPRGVLRDDVSVGWDIGSESGGHHHRAQSGSCCMALQSHLGC